MMAVGVEKWKIFKRVPSFRTDNSVSTGRLGPLGYGCSKRALAESFQAAR